MQWPFTANQWIGIAGTILVSLDVLVKKERIERLDNFCEMLRYRLQLISFKLFRSIIANKYVIIILMIAPTLIILITNTLCIPPYFCNTNMKALIIIGMCLTIILLLPVILILVITIGLVVKIFAMSRKGIPALLGVILLIISYIW